MEVFPPLTHLDFDYLLFLIGAAFFSLFLGVRFRSRQGAGGNGIAGLDGFALMRGVAAFSRMFIVHVGLVAPATWIFGVAWTLGYGSLFINHPSLSDSPRRWVWTLLLVLLLGACAWVIPCPFPMSVVLMATVAGSISLIRRSGPGWGGRGNILQRILLIVICAIDLAETVGCFPHNPEVLRFLALRLTGVFLLGLAVWYQAARGFLTQDSDLARIWGPRFVAGVVGGGLAFGLLGWVWMGFLTREAFQRETSDVQGLSHSVHQMFGSNLEQADLLSGVLGTSLLVIPALASPSADSIEVLQRTLDRLSKTIPQSVAYVIASNGVTIGASNRDQPDSFLGKSYAFRPYFQKAMAGKPTWQLALGVTSGRYGYYSSHPVADASGTVLGVAVAKASFERFRKWLPEGTGVWVVDPEGTTILSNRSQEEGRELFAHSWIGETLPMQVDGWTEATGRPQMVLQVREIALAASAREEALLWRFPIVRWNSFLLIVRSLAGLRVVRQQGLAALALGGMLLTLLMAVLERMLANAIRVAGSEKLHRILVEGSPSLVFSCDPDGTLRVLNRTGLNALNWSAADISRHVWADLWRRDQTDLVANGWQDVCSGHRAVLEGVWDRSPVQSHLWDGVLVPVKDAGTAISQVIGIFNDGTARQVAQESFQAALDETADREKRNRLEMEIAQTVQRELLPKMLPVLAGFSFGVAFHPCSSVSGDFFASFTHPEPEKCSLIFADITGHGIAGAMLAGMFKGQVREAFQDSPPPGVACARLNERLGQEFPSGYFATAFVLELDSRKTEAVYVNASTGGALLLKPGGSIIPLTSEFAPLGMLPGDEGPSGFAQSTISFELGDTLLVLTDGVTDVVPPDHPDKNLGMEGLLRLIKETGFLNPDKLVMDLYHRVCEFGGYMNLPDDITILAIRRDVAPTGSQVR